jgi:hypothetical protein
MYSASKPFERAMRAVNPSNTPGQTTSLFRSFKSSLRRFAPVKGAEAIFDSQNRRTLPKSECPKYVRGVVPRVGEEQQWLVIEETSLAGSDETKIDGPHLDPTGRSYIYYW